MTFKWFYFYWSLTPLFSKYFDPEDKKKGGELNLLPFLNNSTIINHTQINFSHLSLPWTYKTNQKKAIE